MAKSMYVINQEQQLLMDLVMDLDGELTPEVEERLKINEGEMQSKSIAYLSVIQNCELQNDLIDSEIKRLQAMKKRNTNTLKRLKDILMYTVENYGEYQVGLTKFGFRTSTSVEVDDVNALPKEFKLATVTERADRATIKKVLELGGEVTGCRLKKNKNLRIY